MMRKLLISAGKLLRASLGPRVRMRAAQAFWGSGTAALLAASAWLTASALDIRYPPPLSAGREVSTVVVDRSGALLRAFTIADGRWRLPVRLSDVDPKFVSMLIAYEDKRFYEHDGVDPLAMGRSAWQLVSNGRIVSGGSTLSMQLARLLEPRGERSFAAKARQILRAVQIERRLTKHEILEYYLTLAPYGGNLEGIRAASLAYFGKPPRKLTVEEAALLIALPQLPEARRPDRRPEAAVRARNRVSHPHGRRRCHSRARCRNGIRPGRAKIAPRTAGICRASVRAPAGTRSGPNASPRHARPQSPVGPRGPRPPAHRTAGPQALHRHLGR